MFFHFYIKYCRFRKRQYIYYLNKKVSKLSFFTRKKFSKRIKKLVNISGFFVNNCRFHFNKKLHCNISKKLKHRTKILKSVISHTFYIRFNQLRIIIRNYNAKISSALIQASRMKELLIYTKKSFRKVVSSTMRFLIKNGARGCFAKIKGVYRSKRTKTFKFYKGKCTHSGTSNLKWIDTKTFYLTKKRGSIGITIKITNSLPLNKLSRTKPLIPGKIKQLKKLKVLNFS